MTTTISIHDSTKAKFDELRPEDADSADVFLSLLLDYYAGELEDVDREADVGAALTFDDTKEACRAAIREELPVEAMGR